jgi:hypothetical protein
MDYNKLLKPLDHTIKPSSDPLPKNMYIIWTIFGMRGSGKSNLLLASLRHKEFYKNYFDNIFLISPTAKNDNKFKSLVEELEEDDKYSSQCDEATVENVMERIREFNQKWNYKKKKRDPHNLIIFDDCIHALPKSTQKSSIHELITTNRHLKTSIFITSQRFKSLSTLIRSNADVISFFKTNNLLEKKLFCDEYGIDEDTLDAICQTNHDFIHITFTSGTRLIFDNFDKIE